jgi:RIO kinase 1
MSKNQLLEFMEELDNTEETKPTPQLPARASKKRQSKRHEMDARLFIRAQGISRDAFQFTYKAARFEEAWLFDSLADLAEHRWISDVLRKAKAGKEASVYLCQPGAAAPESKLVAAKVYRPRTLRNLKNDQLYRDGRVDLDEEGKSVNGHDEVHAIAQRSSFGETLRHQSWIAHEFRAMEVLFAAGADIPRPYARTGNTIAMDFIGDELGSAPTLNEVALEPDEVQPLFERTMRNVEILLEHGYVHGDLSAYNILYWEGNITLIDFPQVVSPSGNRNAFSIFSRDVTRLCEYFAKQGLKSDPRRLALELWTRHGFKAKEEIHPGLLDPEDLQDRRLWERQKGG